MDFKLNVNRNEFIVGEYNTRLKSIKEKIGRTMAASLYTIDRNAKQNCLVEFGHLDTTASGKIDKMDGGFGINGDVVRPDFSMAPGLGCLAGSEIAVWGLRTSGIVASVWEPSSLSD